MTATQQPASADAGSATRHQCEFSHPHHRMPATPDGGSDRWRRHFTRGGAWDSYYDSQAQVTRHAGRHLAQVQISQGSNGVKTVTTLRLNIDQLRDLAARLLDAADDLEINPSAKLLAVAK